MKPTCSVVEGSAARFTAPLNEQDLQLKSVHDQQLQQPQLMQTHTVQTVFISSLGPLRNGTSSRLTQQQPLLLTPFCVTPFCVNLRACCRNASFFRLPILVEVCLIRAVYPTVYDRPTLRESLSGTFLQILPELVTPPKGHSLSPRSCRPTLSGKNQVVIIFVLSDAIVLPGSCFSMHVYLSYVLSLICETVLCLELVFVELGQAHYK